MVEACAGHSRKPRCHLAVEAGHSTTSCSVRWKNPAYPELADVEIRVEEVPLRERRDGSPDPVALGRLHPRHFGRPLQLILHRKPLELRAAAGSEREYLVNDTVTELVAELFGLSPIQIDPDFGVRRD